MTGSLEIQKLAARINNLEKQIDFLLRINGLAISALRDASDEELLKYYRDAIQLLGLQENQFSLEVIGVWAEIFCQFSEYEFIRIQEILDYEHTWEPFYNLCIKMMTFIRHQKDFSMSIALKNLYGLLNKAQKNLRESAIITIKNYPKSLPRIAQTILNGDNLEPYL
jgi:hypothetical protein